MREATLRDFLHGMVPAERLAAKVREAVEPVSGNSRRVHIEDLPADEINGELTSSNMQMFRDWLTGEAHPSSEPDITSDTLSGLGYLRRTSKVPLPPRLDADARSEV